MVEADSSILLTISLLNARPLLAPRILMGFRCIPRRCGWTYVHFNALETLAAPSASTGSTYRTRTQPYDVLLYAIRRLSYGGMPNTGKYRITVSILWYRYFCRYALSCCPLSFAVINRPQVLPYAVRRLSYSTADDKHRNTEHRNTVPVLGYTEKYRHRLLFL